MDINQRIASQYHPKTESDLIAVLKLLYLDNTKTENSLLRLHADQQLEAVNWNEVKSYYN